MRARKTMKRGKDNTEKTEGEICMRVCPEMGKEGEQEKGGDKGKLENKISRITKKVQSSVCAVFCFISHCVLPKSECFICILY